MRGIKIGGDAAMTVREKARPGGEPERVNCLPQERLVEDRLLPTAKARYRSSLSAVASAYPVAKRAYCRFAIRKTGASHERTTFSWPRVMLSKPVRLSGGSWQLGAPRDFFIGSIFP